MRKLRTNITLTHKAIALVLIPLVFNCIWLFMLFSVLQQAQTLAEMEREQSRFIEELNLVLKDSYQTRENFIGYIASNNTRYLSNADYWIDTTEKALKNLEGLPGRTKEQKVLIAELDEILVDQFGRIRKLLGESTGQSKTGLLQEVEPVSNSVDNILNRYPNTEAHLAVQRRDLDAARNDAKRSSALAEQTVIVGLIGNLVLALGLIFGIRRNLALRLSRLMDNVRRLPQRQPLNDLISGGDELVEMDRSLHEASGELIKAAEFRSSLMQMVAHDLRSPVAACLIGVDILEISASAGGEQGMRQLNSIKNNLGRVIGLTNDLLLLEQFENMQLALSLEAENIKELVSTSCASIATLAGTKQIVFENQCGSDYLMADRQRIIQVIVNYLSNAVKFSPQNSAVIVSSVKNDSFVKVSVRDQGVGIPHAEQAKLFDKFFQAADGRKAGGTGLGLAISKMIIEAHGGEVGVESKPGKGATFWFTLPLHD